jgi:L-threonine-O-3-phosphate decarboxylase
MAEFGSPLPHGGRLRAAALAHGRPLEDWLDLSTGINPLGWQGASPEAEDWRRLPEDEDGLEAAAREAYGASALLPVAGSQAAIRALPRLRAPGRVGVLSPGYNEHAHAWARTGHQVVQVSSSALEAASDALDVLVLANPNNPNGEGFERARLLDLHARLAVRGGWLLVDEAFIDADETQSLATECRAGLIVLRSLGKFYGLAGARVGFVISTPALLTQLADELGPWTVAGPSRSVAMAALLDQHWRQLTRLRLHTDAERLDAMLRRQGFAPDGSCALFRWLRTPDAAALHLALAAQGILTRHFDVPSSLRFGLPGREAEWQRLDAALRSLARRAA